MSAPPDAPTSRFHLARRSVGVGLTSLRDYGIVVSFIAIFVYLTFKSDVFLSKVNLFNVLDGNSSDGIMAVGGTLVLIAGGFDLSVGAIFALSGVIAAMLAPHMDPTLAIMLGALSGLGLGIINGFITTVGRINAIVGTLASSIIISGIALVLTDGLLVNVTTPGFSSLGQGTIFTLHYSVIVWAVFAVICGFLLWRTKYGRYIYASGGNAEAARLSGVIAAMLAPHMDPTLAIILGALSGLGLGIVNGFITTVGRINAIVGTLASSIIISGIALVLTDGLLVNVTTPGFSSLGQGTIFTLHYSVIVWAVFALICGFLLWRTKYGRYIYASGGNAEAARLSGVRVNLIRGSTYAISGLSAGIAGVIVTSRVSTGDASTGTCTSELRKPA